MREGLRSRTRLGTASGGEGVDHKKTVAVKSEAVDLGDEGLEVQKSTIEKKGEVEVARGKVGEGPSHTQEEDKKLNA